MSRVGIIGGGVIGLSIAFELSERGADVVLVERDRIGQKASWSGAGILPPANMDTAVHPLERLEALSNQLHARWAEQLLEKTGIDNGYRNCGGIYLARTPGEKASLIGAMLQWQEREIEFESISPDRFSRFAAGLSCDETSQSVFLPGESQIRNPDHLTALVRACRDNGVEVIEHCGEVRLQASQNATESMMVGGQRIELTHCCIAAGPWSEELVSPFGVGLPMTPVRGQMVLFKLPKQSFQPIVNEGTRYLVPRADGHVLAGATIEEVGFNDQTEPQDIGDLKRWAASIVPALNASTFVKAWAGLRPGSYDGFPYLGALGRFANTFVATGHFKSGLHLSTATAKVIADLVEAQSPGIDLRPFSPARAENAGA